MQWRTVRNCGDPKTDQEGTTRTPGWHPEENATQLPEEVLSYQRGLLQCTAKGRDLASWRHWLMLVVGGNRRYDMFERSHTSAFSSPSRATLSSYSLSPETSETSPCRSIANFVKAFGLHTSLRYHRVARCVPTSTQRQLRQYGGGVFDFPRRVLLLTVPGGFYWSVPRESWCSFPLVFSHREQWSDCVP